MESLHKRKKFNNDGVVTGTSENQKNVEQSVENCYITLDNHPIILDWENHVKFLKDGLLRPLDNTTIKMDASQTWMVYWISHSLYLLGETDYLLENSYKIASFLKRCESPTGGYGGGPMHEAHLAATYAAVSALVTIGNDVAFKSVNVKGVEQFLKRMQQPDGSFTVHDSGEIDIRGAYCALSVAKLLNIPIYTDANSETDLFCNTAKWIASCQTYEGGFGATPGNEAHGGYTFCGVAALVLLDKLHLCDIDALLHWTANKQLQFEGGFCGRTNKLVDGCYSFWIGSIIPIIQNWLMAKKDKKFDHWLFSQKALQEYILICCQYKFGGLIDKPGRMPDFYHTCYALSGLSIAQHSNESRMFIGNKDNLVEPTHLLFNISPESINRFKENFKKQIEEET